jgi:hypothetical protein
MINKIRRALARWIWPVDRKEFWIRLQICDMGSSDFKDFLNEPVRMLYAWQQMCGRQLEVNLADSGTLRVEIHEQRNHADD